MSYTMSGKPRTVTVGYRLPEAIYQQASARAHNRGKKLSEILREATIRGLRADSPLGSQGAHVAAGSGRGS